jgi:hypothetical protein
MAALAGWNAADANPPRMSNRYTVGTLCMTLRTESNAAAVMAPTAATARLPTRSAIRPRKGCVSSDAAANTETIAASSPWLRPKRDFRVGSSAPNAPTGTSTAACVAANATTTATPVDGVARSQRLVEVVVIVVVPALVTLARMRDGPVALLLRR